MLHHIAIGVKVFPSVIKAQRFTPVRYQPASSSAILNHSNCRNPIDFIPYNISYIIYFHIELNT